MGRRRGKEQSDSSKILMSCEEDEVEKTQTADEKGGFFACYLLTSLSPRHKGHTYIGFTVNPRRRIRQHNGELRSGAWRTKSKRPWEMVLCIYGFPTNVSALQFEWAWQHPTESLAVRKAATALKSLRGLAGKIKLVYTMLTLPAWQSLPLTVNFFSTKYTKHSAGCPSLPEHIKVQVSSMEELPCYTGLGHSTYEYEDEDDCDHDEACNKSSDDATAEEITDMTVESDGDQWKSLEDTTNDQNGWPGEDAVVRQSGFLFSFTEYHKQSSSPNVPSLQESSERHTNEKTTSEVVGDTNVFEMDQALASAPKSTDGAVNGDQAPTVGGPIAPCETEVIDLLSPSPAYRIRSDRKKRKVSAVCPEIIDLTSSPMFV